MLDLEPWHDLFVMAGGAAAALAGLLFVAVSLNLEHVLQHDALPTLAAQSVAVLIALVVVCAFVLAPGQPAAVLGIEVLVTGALLSLVGVLPAFRGLKEVERAAWRVRRVGFAIVPPLLLLVAGGLLTAASPVGLDLLLAEVVVGVGLSAFNAWILLIEIRR